jgi:hypothetical protein
MAFPFFWEIFWSALKPYQRNRLLAFINPAIDPMGRGYHALQSKIAIGSGGFFGKGLFGGTQSQLKFLPEGHTDFVFSVFAEEWGFMGVLVLLVLYFLLIWWGIDVAYKAKDHLGVFLAVGVVSMLVSGREYRHDSRCGAGRRRSSPAHELRGKLDLDDHGRTGAVIEYQNAPLYVILLICRGSRRPLHR